MSFPCLICGELPVIPEQGATTASTSGGGTSGPTSGQRSSVGTGGGGGSKRSLGGTTIRTLSKDVSDKIFQNLCKHLYVKSEPYWFIQNPGEQMPLCAPCSGVVLEVYTLQRKVDECQAMIKRQVWKLERMVADTEIASNWMATREEQENEEQMWESIKCPPMAIRIARERHSKFRHQVLQNFKSKVKLRQKLRAAGRHGDDMLEVEPTFSVSLSDPIIFPSDRAEPQVQCPQPAKRSRDDHSSNSRNEARSLPVQLNSNPKVSVTVTPAESPGFNTTFSEDEPSQIQLPRGTTCVQLPEVLVSTPAMPENLQFLDESEDVSDDDQGSQIYSENYIKEEYEYSGDGEESTMEQEDGTWNSAFNDNVEEFDEMNIPEGEEVLRLAPGLALRKAFVASLQNEHLKPSLFLRKLAFAVFGLKQIANSSGISGVNKSATKKSLDRYKFEALREYTIDLYGIRENNSELEDLNRKIRTICCDARKALKRRSLKPGHHSSSTSSFNLKLDEVYGSGHDTQGSGSFVDSVAPMGSDGFATSMTVDQ